MCIRDSQFRQHAHQQVELGAFLDLAGLDGLDQARVATDLAQFEQGVEDDDLATRKAAVGDLVTHLAIHRGAHGFVQVALATFEFDACLLYTSRCV